MRVPSNPLIRVLRESVFLFISSVLLVIPIAVLFPIIRLVPSNVRLDSAFNAPCTPVDVVILLLPKLVIVAAPDEPDEPDEPELPEVPELPLDPPWTKSR